MGCHMCLAVLELVYYVKVEWYNLVLLSVNQIQGFTYKGNTFLKKKSLNHIDFFYMQTDI